MGLLSGTVFDRPPHCERCDLPETECRCEPEPEAPKVWKSPSKQTAQIAVENRKHGRRVTVIRGLSGADTDLPALRTLLKNACGAGGKLDGDVIEVQGGQLERIRLELQSLGYRVRG